MISQVKLIAEPWDVGRLDSYEVGRFPPLWSEWNGRFRDTVRDWWRSQDGVLADFASRICGSADIYGARAKAAGPAPRSISSPCTTDLLLTIWCPTTASTMRPTATLLLSAGVPLLLGGDELGRTQRGNNNAYCQDNEITWFDWSTVDHELLEFTRDLITVRRRHPVFRRRRFATGPAAADLRWFTVSGTEMTDENWADPVARSVAMFIDGATDPDVDPEGTLLCDDDFLVCINAWWEPLTFTVPADLAGRRWDVVCDTFEPSRPATPGPHLQVRPRSAVILRSLAGGVR